MKVSNFCTVCRRKRGKFLGASYCACRGRTLLDIMSPKSFQFSEGCDQIHVGHGSQVKKATGASRRIVQPQSVSG